ncbi:Inner membrane localized protein [Quillaja saponaria]|uniref:Inner membrane localized protein n=1 Tax=Quillaja saponaria TaxID=32244 RepID=A0AAD7L7W6_QUISA|nr:Inner membrane localized protein [Quillaja saponaria]
MATLPSSFSLLQNPQTQFFSGSLKPLDQCRLNISSGGLSQSSTFGGKIKASRTKKCLVVQASGDGGRSSSASVFVGGFVLGGLVVGALGCIYAPQISKALAGADRKDFMRKLPKFIYDEEKALEKTRKILTEKIAQLNSAIDDMSSQLRADDGPNGSAVNSDEIEASI